MQYRLPPTASRTDLLAHCRIDELNDRFNAIITNYAACTRLNLERP